MVSPGLVEVQDYLRQHTSPTAADFSTFESALALAQNIYDTTPAQVRLSIFREVHPANYGKDIRQSLLGVIDEALSLIDGVNATYGHKLGELASGIIDGFAPQHFRMGVFACRALYEEAATVKYYGDQLASAVHELLSTPPSAYRLKRLQKLNATDREGFKVVFDKTCSAGKVLKTWYGIRKIDWRKPNFYNEFKLDSKDPLYPGFFLSALKTVKWQNAIPAPYFYAVLCEATHPNSLSNTLYVDDTSSTNADQLIYVIRKVPKTAEPYLTLYSYVSVPTVECISLIDNYLKELAGYRSSLAKYLAKARRVAA